MIDFAVLSSFKYDSNPRVDLVYQNLQKKFVVECVSQGLNSEYALWMYQGVGRDINECWTEDQFMDWVKYGEEKYGLTMEEFSLVRKFDEREKPRFNPANYLN